MMDALDVALAVLVVAVAAWTIAARATFAAVVGWLTVSTNWYVLMWPRLQRSKSPCRAD